MFNILLCDDELRLYELESLRVGLNLTKFGTRRTLESHSKSIMQMDRSHQSTLLHDFVHPLYAISRTLIRLLPITMEPHKVPGVGVPPKDWEHQKRFSKLKMPTRISETTVSKGGTARTSS